MKYSLRAIFINFCATLSARIIVPFDIFIRSKHRRFIMICNKSATWYFHETFSWALKFRWIMLMTFMRMNKILAARKKANKLTLISRINFNSMKTDSILGINFCLNGITLFIAETISLPYFVSGAQIKGENLMSTFIMAKLECTRVNTFGILMFFFPPWLLCLLMVDWVVLFSPQCTKVELTFYIYTTYMYRYIMSKWDEVCVTRK